MSPEVVPFVAETLAEFRLELGQGSHDGTGST